MKTATSDLSTIRKSDDESLEIDESSESCALIIDEPPEIDDEMFVVGTPKKMGESNCKLVGMLIDVWKMFEF